MDARRRGAPGGWRRADGARAAAWQRGGRASSRRDGGVPPTGGENMDNSSSEEFARGGGGGYGVLFLGYFCHTSSRVVQHFTQYLSHFPALLFCAQT